MAMCTPCSASFSAMPRPMPREPPVTSACLAVMVMVVLLNDPFIHIERRHYNRLTAPRLRARCRWSLQDGVNAESINAQRGQTIGTQTVLRIRGVPDRHRAQPARARGRACSPAPEGVRPAVSPRAQYRSCDDQGGADGSALAEDVR